MPDSVSFNSIGGVVGTGADDEMSGIHTDAIVAAVTNDKIAWYARIREAVRDTVRVVFPVGAPGERRTSDLPISVIVERPGPRPAFIRTALIDIAPKFLSELWAYCESLCSRAERLRVAGSAAEFLPTRIEPRAQLGSARRARLHWLITLLMLNGCASHPNVIDTGCAWVRPIMVSKQDVLTDETARAILTHNETWEAVCSAKK